MASSNPTMLVDGFDVDEPSLACARAAALEVGVGDRVRFHHADGASIAQHEPFDAVLTLEALARLEEAMLPVPAGRPTARSAAASRGS
ncbi:SAM-dependent methyltransferase [Aestuariimicrobium sp. Y1814]|uniref:SAM-dependent methyltransferase n=1 Tax=Aestuariimicrobium sp. Y1814 TaxID=3418742 RepID=UPI003DA6D142